MLHWPHTIEGLDQVCFNISKQMNDCKWLNDWTNLSEMLLKFHSTAIRKLMNILLKSYQQSKTRFTNRKQYQIIGNDCN